MLSVSRQGGIRRYFVGKRGMENHKSYYYHVGYLKALLFFVCLLFFLGGAFNKKQRSARFLATTLFGITAGFYLGRAKEGISMRVRCSGRRAERFGYITTLEPKREDLGVK